MARPTFRFNVIDAKIDLAVAGFVMERDAVEWVRKNDFEAVYTVVESAR